MSDQDCGYWAEGQYVDRDLQADVRGLRTDVDNLLAELQKTRQELRTLRARVNSNEMAAA